MTLLDPALTLITLASLFILGPALGNALVSSFELEKWSVPTQHLVLGFFRMVSVAGLIIGYGALWQVSPKSVAWYSWIQEVLVAGTGPGQSLPAEKTKQEGIKLRQK